ncbi:MAG: sigma-54 dependent transcriptional regulator [Alphaproteobacteria bacterium]|nr:sigma-54 dependent transcriptional regulator [Rhodospirillales bacterium]MCW9045369.1 sigma-54 dependent transcriptional regulator [Alphaproteobacteria bacterium]
MSNAFETLFMGQSPELLNLLRTAEVVAATDVTVLIQGESGTGKELLAEALHQQSPRKDEPFIVVNCAALPENLVETELFGHKKGAFTGAESDNVGRIRSADKGTLFLDEVGELPLSTQAKLLRFLESGECQSVGETKPFTANVRIIAATNRDLRDQISNKAFREDLFYRLNVVPLELPPLRERTGDIPVLIKGMMKTLAASHGLDAPALAKETQKILQKHKWPGNIRELKNLCERLVILCSGKTIQPQHLPFEFNTTPTTGTLAKIGITLPEGGLNLVDLEVDLIKAALDKTSGNQSRAAKLLGLTRDTLLYRMKKHALR